MAIILSSAGIGSLDSTDFPLSCFAFAADANVLVAFATWTSYVTPRTIATATYGAQSLTRLPALCSSYASEGGTTYFDVWYLISPSGNQTLSFTISTPGDYYGAVLLAIKATGAHPSSPIGNTAIATGSSTTPSRAISQSISGSAFLSFLSADKGSTGIASSIGSGEAEILTAEGGQRPDGNVTIGSASQQNPAGDGVMNWSLSGSRPWGVSALEILPAPPPSGCGPLQYLFGRG